MEIGQDLAKDAFTALMTIIDRRIQHIAATRDRPLDGCGIACVGLAIGLAKDTCRGR